MKLLKIKKILLKNKILLGIMILGVALRLVGAYQNLDFGHDQDLESWFVRDIIENHHLRLIGQETSTQGVFIGAIYYYLLVPFYLLFNMSPVGGIALATVLGVFGIWSFYKVFTELFGKKAGLLAALFYAVSFVTVYNDRQVVPTTPVFTWTVWYFYSLYLILKGKQDKGFILTGILVSIIWHMNVSLVLLLPLTLVAFLLSQKKDFSSILKGFFTFLITSIPFFLFELRHNFSQLRYVYVSFTTDQGTILNTYAQFQRVIHIATQNATLLLYNSAEKHYWNITLLLIVVFAYLIYKKAVEIKLSILMVLWIVFYVLFFTFYSKILSEYYLNGMTLMWIAVIVLVAERLFNYRKKLFYCLGILFVAYNSYRIINYPFPENGYVPKTELIAEIKKDALEKGFPCVSISYITNPGYDRGYRYLIYKTGLKTKPIGPSVPVYSIVFPLKRIFPTDKTFETIGLIYPDYKLYDLKTVEKFCTGDDFNTTDSMIGFTN